LPLKAIVVDKKASEIQQEIGFIFRYLSGLLIGNTKQSIIKEQTSSGDDSTYRVYRESDLKRVATSFPLRLILRT